MIVLDASAMVDVVMNEPESRWVLDQLAGSRAVAPAHLYVEVLSALARARRAGAASKDQAGAALREAFGFRVEIAPVSLQLARRALDLQDRIRVLDGVYVALAEDRNCPLVTTDRRLMGAGAPCEVLAPPAQA